MPHNEARKKFALDHTPRQSKLLALRAATKEVDILRLVMGGVKGQKKRRWSDDEKRSICEQTLTPGVSVAQVARRYSMNANLIFTWLRDPRFAPDQNTSAATEDTSDFLPIEIEGDIAKSW